MLYFVLSWIEQTVEPPGFQVFQFITVRAGLAAATALLVALFAGKGIIRRLRRAQIGETVREGVDAGVVSHAHKAGTPTMGGLIIILSIATGTLLWMDLANPFAWVALGATLWMGAVGFADDYIKVIKRNKTGLAKRVKLAGQVTLGILVGIAVLLLPGLDGVHTATSVPFLPDGTFDFDVFSPIVGFEAGWLIYVPVVTFILTGVSNAVNLTDGLDGLAAGTSAFVVLGLLVLVYITGHAGLSDYVNDLFIPAAGELTVVVAALAAACFGFLWYNGYPAQVFMGDTGSLALGGAIGTLAILVKKEFYLPVLCAVFLAETVSVIVQTSYFKWSRRRTGKGERVFRMAPLHHHYEALGIHESKIVIRFWIVTALFVIFTLALLRLR